MRRGDDFLRELVRAAGLVLLGALLAIPVLLLLAQLVPMPHPPP